jgi:SAM-dependent methyltransferase
MIVTVATARLLKLNRLAAFGGCQIGAPPITPFLIWLSVEVGHWLVHGGWAPLSVEAVKAMSRDEIISRFAVTYFVGGTVVGIVGAALAGPLAATMIRRARERSSGNARLTLEELDALDDRLDVLPRRYHQYAAWKARLDPLYPTVLPYLVNRREVLDLGAGIGMLAVLLTGRSPNTRVRSVEWDQEKAEQARKLLAGTSAVAEEGDAFKVELGRPDAICLFDVLHYTPRAQQEELLGRCAQAVADGGALLVRELDPTPGKSSWAERIERWAVQRGWNQGGGVHVWPPIEIKAFLEARGFQVELLPGGRGLFNANALVVAKRLDPAAR